MRWFEMIQQNEIIRADNWGMMIYVIGMLAILAIVVALMWAGSEDGDKPWASITTSAYSHV